MFIDSHCHLHLIDYAKLGLDLADIMQAARHQAVTELLCVATELDQFDAITKICDAHSEVRGSIGVHPCAGSELACSYDLLCDLAQDERIIAIGETGLDFVRADEPQKALQQTRFAMHIEVAKSLGKPLIIHSRQAQSATLEQLRSTDAREAGGIFHCFTEDWPTAKAALDLGFYISLSGILTFKNAQDLQALAQKLPLDRILIETDAPYLAPQGYRGQVNQPAYVVDVARKLAELRGCSIAIIAAQTRANYYALFPHLNAARPSAPREVASHA